MGRLSSGRARSGVLVDCIIVRAINSCVAIIFGIIVWAFACFVQWVVYSVVLSLFRVLWADLALSCGVVNRFVNKAKLSIIFRNVSPPFEDETRYN